MKKIIVLKGTSNTGKTTTIKQLLRKIFKIEIYNPDNDLALSFKYKDKVIAIITMGDNLELIEYYFKKIKEFDILICSCRTRGETLEFYKKKRDSCNVKFIDKTINNDKEQQELISEIQEIISKALSE